MRSKIAEEERLDVAKRSEELLPAAALGHRGFIPDCFLLASVASSPPPLGRIAPAWQLTLTGLQLICDRELSEMAPGLHF